jgi:hypothetical protein
MLGIHSGLAFPGWYAGAEAMVMIKNYFIYALRRL